MSRDGLLIPRLVPRGKQRPADAAQLVRPGPGPHRRPTDPDSPTTCPSLRHPATHPTNWRNDPPWQSRRKMTRTTPASTKSKTASHPWHPPMSTQSRVEIPLPRPTYIFQFTIIARKHMTAQAFPSPGSPEWTKAWSGWLGVGEVCVWGGWGLGGGKHDMSVSVRPRCAAAGFLTFLLLTADS